MNDQVDIDNALNQLVGEDKKFKTPEDLARGKLESDIFIDHLKKENSEMRDELQKRLTLEEALKTKETAPEVLEAPKVSKEADQTDESSKTPDAAENKGENIADVVRQILQEEMTNQQRTSNLDKVGSRLIETYGDSEKSKERMIKFAEDLNVPVDYLVDIASRSPKAFYNLVGLEAGSEGKSAPLSSSVNPEAVRDQRSADNSNTRPGTYKYYEELRKTNPRRYFTPEVQNEMFKARIKEGDSFYN